MSKTQTPKTQNHEPQIPETMPVRPHHTGHRDRLRARFLQGGQKALQDYEWLELLLFLGIPRKDVKPLAKDLIAQFGNMQKVLHASFDELCAVKGMSANAAIALLSVKSVAQILLQRDLLNQPIIDSFQKLIAYCHATMAHEKRELFRVLFLNRKNHLIADEIQNTGTVDHTPVYPREIMKRALELGATALILVHNHPAGDPEPSQDDLVMTRQIIQAATPFEITIHDHIIIGRHGHTSFRARNLL